MSDSKLPKLDTANDVVNWAFQVEGFAFDKEAAAYLARAVRIAQAWDACQVCDHSG